MESMRRQTELKPMAAARDSLLATGWPRCRRLLLAFAHYVGGASAPWGPVPLWGALRGGGIVVSFSMDAQ